jgi:Uma2 family endonuclease
MPLKYRLDYSDLQTPRDDGKRYELAWGTLLVTPSPSLDHQRVSKRLQRQLEAYFERHGIGEVFQAPLDLILTSEDVFVPDLVVVAEPVPRSHGIDVPPLLVIEIVSPATRDRDRGVKAVRYAELGVANYWIVDPEARRIECFRLEEGAYVSIAACEGDGLLFHPDWEGLAIDAFALWRV